MIMKEERINRKGATLTSVLVGGALGAGLALVLAPKSGREIRKDLKRTADKFSHAVDIGKDLYGEGKVFVSKAVDASKKAYVEERPLEHLNGGGSLLVPVLTSSIIGLGIGAGIALLLAPKSGSETGRSEAARIERTERVVSTIDKGKEVYVAGKGAITEAVEAGKKAYVEGSMRSSMRRSSRRFRGLLGPMGQIFIGKMAVKIKDLTHDVFAGRCLCYSSSTVYAFDLFVQFFVRGHECTLEPPAKLNISSVIEGYFVFPGQCKTALKFFQSEVEPFERELPEKRKCLCNGRFGKPRLCRQYIADLIVQQVGHGYDLMTGYMSVPQTGGLFSTIFIIEYPLEDHRGVQDDHLRSRASRRAFTTSI
jgi:gas vesicle protein